MLFAVAVEHDIRYGGAARRETARPARPVSTVSTSRATHDTRCATWSCFTLNRPIGHCHEEETMKIYVRLLAAATLAVVLSMGLPVALSPFSQPAEGQDDTNAPTTADDLSRWVTEFSNHGRWENVGLGAANLITRAKRRAAAKLVERGISVSMAHNVPQEPCAGPPSTPGGPATCLGDQDNTYLKRTVLNAPGSTFISDQYEYQGTYHGSTHSHLDSLSCHVHYQGHGWNNESIEVTQETGCSAEQGGIIAVKDGVFTRGVLIDIARFRGVPWLEAGEGVGRAEIRAWEKWSGVRIRSGDAIFLRTGRWKRQGQLGVRYTGGNPGWHASAIPLFHQRDVSYIGSDHINDVIPIGIVGTTDFVLPVHQIVMPTMGINILDNLDLEAIADLADRLGRYTFLLTVGPLRIDKGLGSPANPIATF
jgi:kynurenine formamidase